MPQGRRKDFSGKQKKLQMQQKNKRKAEKPASSYKETIRGPTSEADERITQDHAASIQSKVAGDKSVSLIEAVALPGGSTGLYLRISNSALVKDVMPVFFPWALRLYQSK